jgi:histidinol phosphatase-like enzyme
VVSKNPSKAQVRKALERASNSIANYVISTQSGVAKGYYTQRDFNKLYDIMNDLRTIAGKMR